MIPGPLISSEAYLSVTSFSIYQYVSVLTITLFSTVFYLLVGQDTTFIYFWASLFESGTITSADFFLSCDPFIPTQIFWHSWRIPVYRWIAFSWVSNANNYLNDENVFKLIMILKWDEV